MSGKRSQAILGPAGVIQHMCLDNTDKGREAFSKIKALLKKAAARTREALIEEIAQALRGITVGDIRGWFAHCGYVVEDQP